MIKEVKKVPNPKGRGKSKNRRRFPKKVEAKAIKLLKDILEDETENKRTRVNVAKFIVEHNFGKPAQKIDTEIRGRVTIDKLIAETE